MHFLVTGASGYIGSRFIERALEGSHKITSTTRCRNSVKDNEHIYFDLDSQEQISLPNGVDAIVHLAAHTSNEEDMPSDNEVRSAEMLMRAAKKNGAKFLFVSSQTAQQKSSSGYGKTKWLIEEIVLKNGGCVVRPGLVYGGDMKGLFGSIAQLVNRLPFLPQFYPSPKVQPIHIDDFILCLIRILEGENYSHRVFSLGEKKSIAFNKFLRKLSEVRFHSKKITIPIPIFLVKIILSIPLIPGISVWRKKFDSLLELPIMNIGDDLSNLNINLRPLNDGMTCSAIPYRRGLLLEARSLMKYILRNDPNLSLLIRYVRALEALEDFTPLGLPSEFISYPFLISLINPMNLNDSELKVKFYNRLNICSMLAESTLLGARRFIKCDKTETGNFPVLDVFYAVLCELICRFLGLLLYPLIQIRFTQSKEHE